MAHVSPGFGPCDYSVLRSNCECTWPFVPHGPVEPGGNAGTHWNGPMVPVSATSEFLLADARAALQRRTSEDGRTELSRAFSAWLLRENAGELVSLVGEAATREGAQQDFHAVAILGFGAEAGLLLAEAVEVLKEGLLRLG